MKDGLDRLSRLNPTSPEELEPLVAMGRDELFELLEEDSGGRPRLVAVSGRLNRSTKRAGYVGAMVAAAAAVVAVVFVTGSDVTTDSNLNPAAEAEAAETATTVQEPLVVDTPADPNGTPTTVADIAEFGEAAEAEVPPEETAPQTSEPDPTTTEVKSGPNVPVMDGPFNASTDLLVLHYDHAHRDDGQATVAALEMTSAYGLTPLVVAGTRRVADYSGYLPPFEEVMSAAWGDEWFNAYAERDRSVNQSASRWLTNIEDGGVVWVAEGGASDFTAEVIREIQRRRPGLDTKAVIQVIQHNQSNETNTAVEDLEFVMDNSTYVRLQDGNSDNDTANLNQTSAGFEADALSGRHGEAWAAAFEYLAADSLDFSDLVEVLHILGIGTDEVANPGDFAERFIR